MTPLVVITGGAGYLGCLAVRAFLAAGWRVRVLDTCWFGARGLDGLEVDLLRVDVRNALPGHVEGATAVVHLAGLSTDPMADFDPPASLAINTDGTEHLARCCIEAGVFRFVFGSTGAVYDRGLTADDTPQDETMELSPRAAYATSKYLAEKRLIALAVEYDAFAPIILRQGTAHGWSPRLRYDLAVNAFIRDAVASGVITVHAGGAQWRPMIHAADLAEAYVHAASAVPAEPTVVNVFEANYRVLEMAVMVRDALRSVDIACDVRIDRTDAGRLQRSYRCDRTRMDALGFTATRSIETGVGQFLRLAPQSPRQWWDPRGENMTWVRLLREMREVGTAY